MSKIIAQTNVNKFVLVLVVALAFCLSVGVRSASATLTVADLTVTSSGALTVEAAAGSATVYNSAQTTGAITLGGTAGTGAITIGSSTGVGQTVTVGGGATTGSDIVNIGTGTATTRKTVNIATGAISTTNIGTGNFVNTIHIGDHATPVNVITIGGAASSVAITDADWSINTAGAAALVSATATTFMSADAYRVTNGTTITATGALTKAELQGASYFLVNTTGSTAVAVTLGGAGESFDAGDIGRTIMFGHGTNTGALTVAANNTLTVATVAAAGAAVDLAGDWIECKILTATLVTCASYAQ